VLGPQLLCPSNYQGYSLGSGNFTLTLTLRPRRLKLGPYPLKTWHDGFARKVWLGAKSGVQVYLPRLAPERGIGRPAIRSQRGSAVMENLQCSTAVADRGALGETASGTR
jgi:hypothetical protein